MFRPFLLIVLILPLLGKTEIYRRGSPFTLHIERVRSLEPGSHVGFSKSLEVYRVDATGPKAAFVLYCTKDSPQAGASYRALDEYVSADRSWLHLWPVEKSTLALPSDSKKKGRLFRVVVLQDIHPKPPQDLACDLYSEHELPIAAKVVDLQN